MVLTSRHQAVLFFFFKGSCSAPNDDQLEMFFCHQPCLVLGGRHLKLIDKKVLSPICNSFRHMSQLCLLSFPCFRAGYFAHLSVFVINLCYCLYFKNIYFWKRGLNKTPCVSSFKLL